MKPRRPSHPPAAYGDFHIRVDGVWKANDRSEEEAWRIFLDHRSSDTQMFRGAIIVAATRKPRAVHRDVS